MKIDCICCDVLQFYHALYSRSTFACMCITTTAWKDRLAEPLYRKRRKKGRGRGPQNPALPALPAKVAAAQAAPEKSVVVVESPAKAKTIEKYLGERHVVLPSFGHVRDLAAKSGSVRPDEDFKLVWEVPSSARQHLNAIKAAIKGYLSHTSSLITRTACWLIREAILYLVMWFACFYFSREKNAIETP